MSSKWTGVFTRTSAAGTPPVTRGENQKRDEKKGKKKNEKKKNIRK